jgi:hypothetical protein
MPGLESLIAGLAEAETRYRETQLDAFLGLEPDVCGVVHVKPFTPQMYIELSAAGNRFFTGEGSVGVADVLQFLWRVSEKFDRDDREKRTMFWQALSVVNATELRDGVIEYIERSWAQMPSGEAGKSQSAGAWPSYIVHCVANAYGWSESEILNTPFRRLFQYIHRILESKDPEYRQRCPEAMKLRADWLAEQNSRN